MLQGEVILRLEPTVLDLFPKPFDAVEVRAVFGQEKQVEPLLFPLYLFGFEGRTRVQGRIVEHHYRWPLKALGKVSETFNDKGRIKAFLFVVASELTGSGKQAKHVYSASVLGENTSLLASLDPTVRNSWHERKAALIAKTKVNVASLGQHQQSQ